MRTEDGYIIYECLYEKPEAFAILVDKYKSGIYAYVYAELHNFQDAQDVTQEVFLQAYRNLRSLRRWESFASWLYRIARNLSKKWIQAESRRPDRAFVEDQNQKILEDTSMDSYRESQVNEDLHEALSSLPENYREALMLYYFGGLSSVDIARALHISPAAVRHRLSRGRKRLKEEMIAMMSTDFEEQRLQSSFTFRIVEAIKRIKVHPTPRMSGLPWGLSLVTGLMIAVLGINPHLSLRSASTGATSPGNIRANAVGEISVELLMTPQIPLISSDQNGNRGRAELPRQNAVFMPQGEQGLWAGKADAPTARWWLSTSEVNGKIYAIGGEDDTAILSTVEEYDPATDTWTQKADMPTPRCRFTTSVMNGKIYAIGGVNREEGVLSTVEEYDPIVDKWTSKADMPTPRGWLSSSVVDGKIYAIGGVPGWNSPPPLSALEEYDPVADKWTKKADMPTARGWFSSSAVDGKIYVIGGGDGKNIFPTIEEYDPARDRWKKKVDMIIPRWGLSTCVLHGKIYSIGGVSGDDWDAHSTVEEYDPLTNRCREKSRMPTARGWLSISEANGRIYAIGGTNTFVIGSSGVIPLSVVEEYDIGSAGKSIEPKGKSRSIWGSIKQDTTDGRRLP